MNWEKNLLERNISYDTLTPQNIWDILQTNIPKNRNSQNSPFQMLHENDEGDLIEKSIDPITISTIERLCAEQAYSKALSRLGPTGIHSPSEETYFKLQNLHPQKFTPWNPPSIDEQKGISDFWDTFWDNTPKIEEKILAAISSFAPGSAGGPGGLKPSQLQDILKSCTPHTKSLLIKGFFLFIQNWTKGRFPPHIAHYFMSASLTPLKKPDGGLDL